eukprot:GHRR01001950.1.p1 GENE.GHRR01001950.1~~GHRR01001950.1.p1  ORF type:complete len:522 (+),score=155.03 GHRR01001950.1:174-1739(+)
MARQQEANWLRRHRHYVVIAFAATAGTVAAYKVYRSERLKSTQKVLQQAAETFVKYSDAAATAGDILAIISDDIRQFLSSNADEVPNSLRQLSKLAQSQQVQDSLAACVSSAVKGMLAATQGAEGEQASVIDKVIEAVLSDRGHSLVGLAIRTAAQQSTETVCHAVRQGIEATFTSSRRHNGRNNGSTASSAAGSPQCNGHAQHNAVGLQLSLASVIAVLRSPQLLGLIDSLVSTTIGSAVGAYMDRAGSADIFASLLDALAKPGNKEVIVDILSSVSSTFCREMAAACVAPAAAVASRPSSRLDSVDLHTQHTVHAAGAVGASSSKQLPGSPCHSAFSTAAGTAAGTAAATDDGSGPSTPQSGPCTPEPSVIAAQPSRAVAFHPGSFAGSAVAGLIMRRNSFPGLGGWNVGGSSSNGGAVTADPACFGPMSTLVSLFVQAARFQEFRSLMVDVSRGSTREFVHSLLPSSWSLSSRSSAREVLTTPVVAACMYKVYTMVSVMLFLMVYALGPHSLIEGSNV